MSLKKVRESASLSVVVRGRRSVRAVGGEGQGGEGEGDREETERLTKEQQRTIQIKPKAGIRVHIAAILGRVGRAHGHALLRERRAKRGMGGDRCERGEGGEAYGGKGEGLTLS
jgi:hypothetical protein